MPQVTPSRSRPGSALLAALSLAACGRGNSLEGSLGEIVDLAFTDVEVTRTETAVSVSYFRPVGSARDIVLRVVIYGQTEDAPLTRDLAPLDDGTPQIVCTRAVADDPVRTFAKARRGSVTFDAKPQIDLPLSGEWSATLDDGGDAGKGRTAFGTFDVTRVLLGG